MGDESTLVYVFLGKRSIVEDKVPQLPSLHGAVRFWGGLG